MLKYILFDLDETLYPSRSGLMAGIGELMSRYMEERLDMPPGEIPTLREHYYHVYGTTMRGLQIHHGIDPEDYLAYVHNIPIEDYIGPNDELDRVLAEIETEKVVFTNASAEHARRVLAVLGIERHFSHIIDVRALGYIAKPDPEAYQRALEILGAEGDECLIVDDRVRNLAPAKELGMITVLVGSEKTADADFVIGEVAEIGEVVQTLGVSQNPKGLMTDKVMSLREAAGLVQPGDTLALGGMTLYRRPVAFVRELIRQGTGDLTLLALTAGYESDLLVGAGLVRRVRTCYFGLEVFGLAPMFTSLATAGEVAVIEETEASIAFGLRAALAGVSFMPGQGWRETDLLRVRSDVQLVNDPYSERSYVAFPAIHPDVAVIHARAADRSGNALLGGNLAVDWELSLAAKKTIVTTECLVEELEEQAEVLGLFVNAVVESPRGAHPTSCYPDYPLASEEILNYVEACAAGRFDEYLEEFINFSFR